MAKISLLVVTLIVTLGSVSAGVGSMQGKSNICADERLPVRYPPKK